MASENSSLFYAWGPTGKRVLYFLFTGGVKLNPQTLAAAAPAATSILSRWACRRSSSSNSRSYLLSDSLVSGWQSFVVSGRRRFHSFLALLLSLPKLRHFLHHLGSIFPSSIKFFSWANSLDFFPLSCMCQLLDLQECYWSIIKLILHFVLANFGCLGCFLFACRRLHWLLSLFYWSIIIFCFH